MRVFYCARIRATRGGTGRAPFFGWKMLGNGACFALLRAKTLGEFWEARILGNSRGVALLEARQLALEECSKVECVARLGGVFEWMFENRAECKIVHFARMVQDSALSRGHAGIVGNPPIPPNAERRSHAPRNHAGDWKESRFLTACPERAVRPCEALGELPCRVPSPGALWRVTRAHRGARPTTLAIGAAWRASKNPPANYRGDSS